MATSADQVRSEVKQLADALLDDVEQIAARSVARMRELLPSYAKVPAGKLTPVTLANTRNLLEAVREPGANSARDEGHFRVSGETRVSQGIAADEMLQAWRIGLEVVREEAHPVASQLGIDDDVLLAFVEATLQWGDLGMRRSAAAYRETEIRELERLAAEQAALRLVATLVAQDVAPEELFGAVAGEVGTLFGADYTGMIRYEPGHVFVTTMATWAAVGEHPPAPVRSRIVPGDPTAMVADTGKPARVDDWTNVPGPIAEFVRRELGVKSSVGSPIVVNGSLWGALAVHSKRSPLPPDTESRLLNFTELVATAIANAGARAEVSRLAEEQAALRRVATLVAKGGQPSEVFDTVAAEVAGLLQADHVVVCRYEPDAELTVLAHRGTSSEQVPAGTRIPHEGDSVEAVVWRTQRSARLESYEGARGTIAELARAAGVQVAVGAPVVVDGRIWGVASAGWNRGQPPPADTEERMAKFAELLSTAVANAEARAELRELADEEAALRRVATLVARAASAEEVFAAVTAEAGRALGADLAHMSRYDPDGAHTIVAGWTNSADTTPMSPGTHWGANGQGVAALVFRADQPARRDDDYSNATGPGADVVRRWGLRSAVGAPIRVAGRLWGVLAVVSRVESLPVGTEERMAKFAELLGTAVANADSRGQLTASRARLVTEADQARRRVVRDLHDGAQQRLLQTIVTLKLAERALEPDNGKAEALISEALAHAQQANTELRELAHGILPAVLAHGGLRSGISSIVSRLDLPVEVEVPGERFPAEIEASAYFVVAEALTNVVKHSHAGRAGVRARMEDGMLRVEIRDDGVGGADPGGHGLVGLGDRVTAIGGQLAVESPEGGGTLLTAKLPVPVGQQRLPDEGHRRGPQPLRENPD